MSDLLQLPQGERLALAIALWDSVDDETREGALFLDSALGQSWIAARTRIFATPKQLLAGMRSAVSSASDDTPCVPIPAGGP